jgi:glycosyltransferase involved in cell wall biosynthesis
MHILVTDSARFTITPDGNLWTSNSSKGYQVWSRYLNCFDQVRLLVRAKPCHSPPEDCILASGVGVTAVPLPTFVGPVEFALIYPKLQRSIRQALTGTEAIHLRVPCPIAGEVSRNLPPDRPFGVEVINDPYENFAPGAINYPFRAFFRWWLPRQLRHQCQEACAALYVTKETLQQRYPCPNYSIGVSDVELPEEAFVRVPRQFKSVNLAFTLVVVGSLQTPNKGVDTLIQAIASCVRKGHRIKLTVIGDGLYRSSLEKQAEDLGVSSCVHFCGQLANRNTIFQLLDQADLFVLPSRSEGLPRAMIEAMARSLPCIGSEVGGIPELLAKEDMVPPGNSEALALKICEVTGSLERLTKMSVRNLEKAKKYQENVLHLQRMEYYRHLREKTEEWMKRKQV